MKTVLIISTVVLTLCYAAHLPSSFFKPVRARPNENNEKSRRIDLPDDLLRKIETLIEHPTISNGVETRDDGGITAVINEYADRILENVNRFLVEHGYDPLELPDQELDFIGGSVKMSNGWLTEVATLQRNGDLTVAYSHEIKKTTFTIPLEFPSLLFLYDYVTKVTLITIDGGIDGTLDNVRIDLILSFDFNTYQAYLEKVDITDTGKISIHFSGNGLVDWIINAMSEVITVFLHPLILGIAELVVREPAQKIVDAVNDAINSILHPTTPTTEIPTTEAAVRGFYTFRNYRI